MTASKQMLIATWFVALLAHPVLAVSAIEIKDCYRLVPTDEDTMIQYSDGTEIYVEISNHSNDSARRGLKYLNYSIFISTRNKDDKSPSPICLMGTFGVKIPGRTPVSTPGYATEGVPQKTVFNLKTVIITLPLLEYPQSPDPAGSVMPVLRHNLTVADFKGKLNPKELHFDQRRGLYWIGENPF
jgi:hypothetical protein